MATIREVRDDVQEVFRAVAMGERPKTDVVERMTASASTMPAPAVRWRSGHGAVMMLDAVADPSAAIAHHFARMAIDVLIVGTRLRVCTGPDCLKVFVPGRSDRRWCDDAVCGNRSRVRAHRERQRRMSERAPEGVVV